jgi:hypothetical protein
MSGKKTVARRRPAVTTRRQVCRTRIGPLELLSKPEVEGLLSDFPNSCACNPTTHAKEFVAWFKKNRGWILK